MKGKQALLERIQIIQDYERKCEEIRISVEKKTEQRENRVNAEVADQKRRDIRLAAAEKLTKKDEGR